MGETEMSVCVTDREREREKCLFAARNKAFYDALTHDSLGATNWLIAQSVSIFNYPWELKPL